MTFKEELKTISDPNRICDFIVEYFENLFDENKFDEVAEILNSFEIEDFHNSQVPCALISYSGAIDPLIRAIPKEETLTNLEKARIILYPKCVEYYKVNKLDLNIMAGLEPKGYKEELKWYSTIWPNVPKIK